jgi:hypothetical protein
LMQQVRRRIAELDAGIAAEKAQRASG